MTQSREVRLLVLSTCVQCKALKDMLVEYRVAFESTDVDLLPREERQELFEKMAPYNEKKAFPVTFIDDKAIIGFQKTLILEALGLTP